MMERAVIVAVLIASGCASYAGGGRPIDPARVVNEPGWIKAAPTPQVRQQSRLDCGAAALAMEMICLYAARHKL